MLRRLPALAIWLLLCLAICGCAHRRTVRCCVVNYDSGNTIDSLPAVDRGSLEPSVEQVPDVHTLELTLGQEVTREYRALTPAEAQCLAAQESSLGNLLAAERNAVQSSDKLCHRGDRSAAIMRRALSYAASEARNQSAGDSLEAYYRLVEAEGLRDVLSETTTSLQQAIDEVETLRRRGITIPPGANEIERRQSDLQNRIVEDQLAIVKLNNRLRQLTGLKAPDNQVHFWPVVQLNVTTTPIDVDSAVAEGLQMRPELNLLRFVERQLDEDMLPVARQVVSGVTGILGTQPSTPCCCSLLTMAKLFCSTCAEENELAARRRQLSQYRADREQAVEAEIRENAYSVDSRLRQIAIVKERVAATQQDHSDAQERQQAGRGSFVEIETAELAMLQARADLVSAVASWEVARAALRESQGLLACECGNVNMLAGGKCP